MKWTYPSLLLYWVWQVAHIIWWNQPLLFIPCRDPFLKGSGFVCNATVSRIRQFDRMRVLQSCEMVSTCTELTYVLGLAGGGYVESVVWWNDPLLFISCQDPFPKSLRNARNVESNGQLYMVCRVCRWLFLSWKKEVLLPGEDPSNESTMYNMYKAKLYLRKLRRT